ncbi:MAG: hypothetical protein J5726_11380 [Treponema sp.]|nr:hypothetical protein [Treponema sp.]
MLASNYIVYAALALYVIVLLTIPFRIKKHGKESLKGRGAAFWAREAAIFIAAAAIIVLCRFIHFEPFPTVALCGCGVLAALVGTQEL